MPEIEVTLWQRLASGLIVPNTIAADAQEQSVIDVASDLLPPARPVAIPADIPHSSDQLMARPNERELGVTPSDLEFLAGEAAHIPFEPAMLAIGRPLPRTGTSRSILMPNLNWLTASSTVRLSWRGSAVGR